MATVIICIVIIVICIFGVKSYVGRLANGCCGGGSDGVKKEKPVDSDLSHFPYTYEVGVEGMSCKNCVARVENAFNTQPDGKFYATVNLGKKLATVHTKEEVEREELRSIVVRAGYDITKVEKK